MDTDNIKKLQDDKRLNESNMVPFPEEILDDILDDVPEEHRKKVEKLIIASSVQMRGMGSLESSVMNKLTSQHITEYLHAAETEMQNSYAERKQKNFYTFITFVISMIFIIVIILLLKDMPDIMEKIIYTIGGLIAGAIGGYGYGKSQNGHDE